MVAAVTFLRIQESPSSLPNPQIIALLRVYKKYKCDTFIMSSTKKKLFFLSSLVLCVSF